MKNPYVTTLRLMESRRMRQLQTMLPAYAGRFAKQYNADYFKNFDNVTVDLEFDYLDDMQAFLTDWEYMTTPIRETRRALPWHRRAAKFMGQVLSRFNW